MARLANARTNHMTRWVIPVAKRLLIEEVCKNAPTQPLGEVAHIEMGQSPDGDSCNDDGDGIPLIGGPADLGLEFPQSTRWTNSPTKLCRPGDIIVCVRATIGEPRWADGIYCLGRGVAGIRPIDKYLLPKFLFFIIEGNEQILQDQGTGTTFKTISKQHLASIQVPMIAVEEQEIIVSFLLWLDQNSNSRPNFLEAPSLPASLTNQFGIVAWIEELAAKIEEARGLRRGAVEETEALINSVMRQIFSSNNEYQLVSLESVCDSIIDNLHSNPIYADQGIPCVRSPDVGWGKLYLDTALKTNEEEYSRRTVRGEPRPDDIVLVREGGGTGKAAIVEEGQRFSLGQRVMMLRPDKQVVMPKFLLYQLLSPVIYEDQILPLSKGSAAPHLNIGALRNFAFVLPSLPEQCSTVAYLDDLQSKIDSLKQLQAETSAELDALLPSILDKAFRGEL